MDDETTLRTLAQEHQRCFDPNIPMKVLAATVLGLLDELDARGADLDTHREIVADQLAEIDRLRGLAKWASGQLFDAGRTEDADRVLQLLDDAQASAPATADDKPDTDGAWPMPLACAFSDACPDGCRGVCETAIGGANG